MSFPAYTPRNVSTAGRPNIEIRPGTRRSSKPGSAVTIGSRYTLDRTPIVRSVRTYPSVRDGQFCSNECAKDPDKRQVTITCPNCEETFERRQSLDTTYCSMACWGEDNRVTADIDELYRGIWHRQRQLALRRDGYRCVVCGISDDRHREQFGHGLDVHHFVPVRRFIECGRPPREAHALKNLVSVCWTHHPDAGGQTVNPRNESPETELEKLRYRYR